MARDRNGRWVLAFVALVGAVFLLSFAAGRLGLFEGGGLSLGRGKIGVVPIEGVLSSPREIIRQIKEYNRRKDVKAIVLRIDSPGGTVVAAQEIYGEIRKVREQKVVVASMGTVAASGGYYVASAAEEIVANPGTLTGSIGVISEYANFRKLMEKLGLKSEVLKSGRYKDIGNPTREMTDDERALLQTLLDDIHGQFIRDVAEGRGKTVEEVRRWADGRIFTGRQAQELGLVDRLGNFQDALDRAAEMAGIEGTPEILYPKKKRRRIWEYLVEGFARGVQSLLVAILEEETSPGALYREGFSVSGRR